MPDRTESEAWIQLFTWCQMQQLSPGEVRQAVRDYKDKQKETQPELPLGSLTPEPEKS